MRAEMLLSNQAKYTTSSSILKAVAMLQRPYRRTCRRCASAQARLRMAPMYSGATQGAQWLYTVGGVTVCTARARPPSAALVPYHSR